MAKMHEVAQKVAPPPPKEATRLFRKAVEQATPVAARPPRGWMDEDEVISDLNTSREELTKLTQDGYFEVSGYATARGNRRCFKKDGVQLFAKIFPSGSQPTGEGSRMLILGALQFAKAKIATGEEFTAKEAMDAAHETVAIAKWVYDGGENRRPKNRPDKDTGIYRWPTEKQREDYAAYIKRSAAAQAKAEAEAKDLQEALDAKEAKEAEERELFDRAVQAEVTEITNWLGETPKATDEEIETVVSSAKPELQDAVRLRVQAFVAEARRELSEEEIDAKLFNVMNKKANRSPFVMRAIYSCVRTRNAAFLPYNLTICEQYAAARFRVASWMRAHSVRQPTAVDVRFYNYIYPTHDDYVAFLAWLSVKREDTSKTMEAANAIIRTFASARKEHELSEAQIGMIHKALKNEGWKTTVVAPMVEVAAIVEEASEPIDNTPVQYHIDAGLAKVRFGVDDATLGLLAEDGAVRTTTMNLVGETNTPITAYNEVDLAIYRHLRQTHNNVWPVGLVGMIKELRPDATYEDQIFRIKGEVPNVSGSGTTGGVDIYLSAAEISAKLKLHVATVGSLGKLGIARTSGEMISLLDVTILHDLFKFNDTLGVPSHEELANSVDTYKTYIKGEYQYYKYSPTKTAYTEIRVTKKKESAKPTKKARAPKTAAAVVPKVEEAVASPKKVIVRKEVPAEEKIIESEAAEAVKKLDPEMAPLNTAYKMFGIAIGRLKVLIEQGVLRGTAKSVSVDDCAFFKKAFPRDIVSMDLSKVKATMYDARMKVKAPTTPKPSSVVASMINTAEAVLARKGDNDSELVLVVPKFKSLDEVKLFFSGAVVERYGSDPSDWPDVMRGLGLGLGVIKKGV